MKNKHVFLLILGLGFLTFFNSFFNPFINDDIPQIVTNKYVQNLTYIPYLLNHSGGAGLILNSRFLHSFYRPLMLIAFTFLYHFFGMNVIAFHVFQVLIHILNSFLIFSIFSNFITLPISVFLAIVFLVHPLNSETAIYIANLQDSLFLFFGLSALYLISSYKDSLISYKSIFFIALLLLLSFLSKETALLFLLTLPIYTFLFSRKNIKRVLLSALIALGIYLPMRLISLSHLQSVGLPSLLARASLLIRLMTIPRIIFYYLNKFIIPINFAYVQQWLVKTIDIKNFYIPLALDILFLMFIFFTGLYIYKKKRELFKPYVFFAFWFELGLLMHLQILPFDATVADRWFYFPMIGLLGMIGVFMSAFLQTKNHFQKLSDMLSIAGTLIILILICLTIIRNTQWKTSMTLYSHDIQYAGDSPLLYDNYGGELLLSGRIDEARYYFKKSIALDPLCSSCLNNLATTYAIKKDYNTAKSLYWKAINLNNGYPKFKSYELLIRITLFSEKNPNEAKKLIDSALKKYPTDALIQACSAITQYLTGDKETALETAKTLVLSNPTDEYKGLYYLIQTDQLTLDKLNRY
jgi:hypothetical protein